MQNIHCFQDPSQFPKTSTVHVASHQAASLISTPPYFVLTPGTSQPANTDEPPLQCLSCWSSCRPFWESKSPIEIFLLPDSLLICFAFYSLFFFLFFRITFCFYILLSFHFLSQVAGTIDIHLHLIFLGLSLTHKYLLSLLALLTV